MSVLFNGYQPKKTLTPANIGMDIKTAFTISVCFLSLSALVNIVSGSVINKIGRRRGFLYGKYVYIGPGKTLD